MKARAFTIGFCLGLLPFIGANVYSYHRIARWVFSPDCFDCGGACGFPLEMFAYIGFFSSWHVFWEGLAANIAIALCAGAAAGLAGRRFFDGPRFR